MQQIIQELIALSYVRRDNLDNEQYYQDVILPSEDLLEARLDALGLPLGISWDGLLDQYVLFPTGILFAANSIEPSEAERLSLLEPTPYDAGVCQGCGQPIAAGMLHAHRCISEDERIESRTWEWEERRYEGERLAYCGWEEF